MPTFGTIYEDGLEIWGQHNDNNFQYEAFLNNFFEPTPNAGEVYLTRCGRRMEDIEVCEAGKTLKLSVVSAPGAASPSVEVEDDLGRRKILVNEQGDALVPFKKGFTFRLQVSSGGYIKPYLIYAVEPAQIKQIPNYADLIKSLAENPPDWTEKTFKEFQNRLETILNRDGVPKLFTSGILEYHLGLFQEQQKDPNFRERLQAAYGYLRWFIPFSDISRLICSYYLFCANDFEASIRPPLGSGCKIAKTSIFFIGLNGSNCDQTKKVLSSNYGLPLLVQMTDALTFQAVEAFFDGRKSDAIKLCAIINKKIIPEFHRERAERVKFLEACLKQKNGNLPEAKEIFKRLQESPWESISSAAKNSLKKISHE